MVFGRIIETAKGDMATAHSRRRGNRRGKAGCLIAKPPTGQICHLFGKLRFCACRHMPAVHQHIIHRRHPSGGKVASGVSGQIHQHVQLMAAQSGQQRSRIQRRHIQPGRLLLQRLARVIVASTTAIQHRLDVLTVQRRQHRQQKHPHRVVAQIRRQKPYPQWLPRLGWPARHGVSWRAQCGKCLRLAIQQRCLHWLVLHRHQPGGQQRSQIVLGQRQVWLQLQRLAQRLLGGIPFRHIRQRHAQITLRQRPARLPFGGQAKRRHRLGRAMGGTQGIA